MPSPPFQRRLPADVTAIGPMADALAHWAGEAGVPRAVVQRLHLVLDELITNSVMHGFGPTPPAQAVIEVDVTPAPAELQVCLRDNARAFNPLSLQAADTTLALDEREPGGLGVHFVRTLTHNLRYQRQGEVNELRFSLALTPPT